MKKDLALDLKLSRNKAGLSGNDMAHLLGCNAERISRLENGYARIKADEIAALSLVFGTDPAKWMQQVTCKVSPNLRKRLPNMPVAPKNWALHQDARQDTLNGLAYRLQVLSRPKHAA